MSAGIIVLISMAILFSLLFMNQCVAVALGATGLLLLVFIVGSGTDVAAMVAWSQLAAFSFMPLPLFIFMGYIILRSGLGDRLYTGLTPWVSRLPGGLVHSNIASCTFFAAISGSSVATAGTIGSFAIPEMTRRGYDKRLILGSLAGSGALGLLIPPSLTMIVYAGITKVSLGHLFMGGIIPGVMTAIFFMVYIIIRATINPSFAPREPTPSRKDLLRGLYEIWPILFIIVAVLGGIYGGVVTPTEAAALGTTLAIILGLAHRRLSWERFRLAVVEGAKTTSMIAFIIVGAFILHIAWGSMHVARDIVAFIGALGLPSWVVLLSMMIFYLFLGCLFDGISMTLLTVPVVFPLIVAIGYDPLWFGVALTMTIEIAQITPPVGLNLFVLSGIGKAPVMDVIRGAIPFFFLHVLSLTLVCFFPQIILWLPSISYARP